MTCISDYMWVVLLSRWNSAKNILKRTWFYEDNYKSCLLQILHVSPLSQDIYDLLCTITPFGLVYFQIHQAWEAKFNALLPDLVYSAFKWDKGLRQKEISSMTLYKQLTHSLARGWVILPFIKLLNNIRASALKVKKN